MEKPPAAELPETPETRCSRPPAPGSSEVIPPCLGLYNDGPTRGPVSFSFDLTLKSMGAPKDVLVGQCQARSNLAACSSGFSEARAEQERLSDTLNRQRQPVATVGVAVSF